MSATAQATLALNANQFNAALAAAGARLNAFGNRLSSSIGSNVTAQLAAVTAGVFGVTTALSAMSNALSKSVTLNSSLEQTRISLATLLGQFRGDEFGDFNSRVREASNILELLRAKGRVAEATFSDLATTLQMTAGSFFAEGIKGAEDQVDMIVAVSQALAAYGGDQASLTREITALLRGQMDPWNRVAKGAGLTAEALKRAKAEGTLFKTIMAALGPVIADAEQGMTTFNSLVTSNAEEIDNLTTALGEPMFEVLKTGLGEALDTLKDESFKDAVVKLSYQLALVAKAGVNMATAILKALPTIISVAQAISTVLIPALAALVVHKLTTGAAATAMAAKVSGSLVGMRMAFVATMTSATAQLRLLSVAMAMQPTLAQKVGMAYQFMGLKISVAMRSMAATTKAAFMSMLASGKLAAVGIQAALAAAMAGFMYAMGKVAKIEQKIGETEATGEGIQSDHQEGLSARGFRTNPNGGIERTSTGVSTADERDSAVQKFADRRAELEKELAKQESDNDESKEAQMATDALRGRIANLKAIESAIGKITDAQLRENAVLKENARIEEERLQHIAQLPQKITEATKALEKSQAKAAFDALSPEQQQYNLLRDAGYSADSAVHKDSSKLDADIAALQKANADGDATVEQQDALLLLISTKEQLLQIEKEIAAEAERAAKREAELAERRQERSQEHAEDLAIKQAQAAGDTETADRLQDEQRVRQMQAQLEAMGYSATEAATMGQQSVDADNAISGARQSEQRQRNEQDIAAQVALATGDDQRANAIKQQQRFDDIVKDQQAMGYSEEDAKKNAQTITASEEAAQLEAQLNKAGDGSPLAASSTMSVGGGGYSVGGGIDPMVEENRRHTRLLEIIAANTGGGRSGRPATASATQPTYEGGA
jgi:hypothetical protein